MACVDPATPGPRLALRPVVDAETVADVTAVARACPGTVLDLSSVEVWTPSAVRALASLLRDPALGVSATGARTEPMLDVMRAAGLREVWAVYDAVRVVTARGRRDRTRLVAS